LPFCSNCGTEINEAIKYCKKCGYKFEDFEPSAKNNEIDTGKSPKREGKIESTPTGEILRTDPEEGSIRVPTGAKVKSRVPKSTTCAVCNTKTDDICYFCDYAVCGQHNVKMQVFADKSKFGNVIESCPNCATKKEGKQPSKEEADGIGFFFNIKPYHEWKILD
jgi:hypothetical protein